MKFLDMLNNNKRVVLEEWFSSIVDSYPSSTSNFVKNQKDPFANPVGQTTFSSLNNLLESLISETDRKKIELYVDPIVRIRAVQNFKPSEAVGFTFALKNIVRKCICTKQNGCDLDGLASFDSRVDILAMISFDVYMSCREKIYELKANEARNQFFSSLSRAGLIVEA